MQASTENGWPSFGEKRVRLKEVCIKIRGYPLAIIACQQSIDVESDITLILACNTEGVKGGKESTIIKTDDF